MAGGPGGGDRRLERTTRGCIGVGDPAPKSWPASTSKYDRMRAAAASLTLEELRSPDGWSWVYDCLYGHVRKHLALIGPWCATVDWPDPGAA